MRAELVKWGNSQGLRIPRRVCDSLGITVGSKAEYDLDIEASTITVHFSKPKRKYTRSRKVSMEELMAGWEDGKAGEEWGGPDVGAEVVG